MRIKAPLNETGWLNTSKYWLGVFVVVAFGSTLAICTEASPLFVNVAVGKSPATSAFPYSTLFGFVNVAEQIGTATISKRGLMPSKLVPVDDTSGVTSINLNTSKSIGRVYAGLRTIFSNYPTELTHPYMGAFNLGYTQNGQLIQFLFSNDDSGNYAVHHRCCYAGNNWTEWKKLL